MSPADWKLSALIDSVRSACTTSRASWSWQQQAAHWTRRYCLLGQKAHLLCWPWSAATAGDDQNSVIFNSSCASWKTCFACCQSKGDCRLAKIGHNCRTILWTLLPPSWWVSEEADSRPFSCIVQSWATSVASKSWSRSLCRRGCDGPSQMCAGCRGSFSSFKSSLAKAEAAVIWNWMFDDEFQLYDS